MRCRRFLILLLLGLGSQLATAQRGRTLPRLAFGIQVDVGHSFPDLPADQQRWKATFYPAGGMGLSLMARLNEQWSADLALGIAGYALANRGPSDTYVLDFASPTALAGLCYNTRRSEQREVFLRTAAGAQLGYAGRTVDRSENYVVLIDGGGPVLGFLRQEVGIRQHTRRRMRGSRHATAFEVGAFFRYNLRPLGVVQFVEPDVVVSTAPNGHLIGMYFRYLIPMGEGGVKRSPTKEPAEVPTRFHDTRTL